MPTVHLSLPESLYRTLREKAMELGVQITDLIKFYIKKGLENEYLDNESQSIKTEVIEGIESVKREVEEKITNIEHRVLMLEGKYYELKELIRAIMRSIEELQDSIEELKGSEVEPEIVHRR